MVSLPAPASPALLSQIEQESGKFGQAAGIRSCCLYGGSSKGPQIRDVKYGVDLVIATPGRLLDMATMVCRVRVEAGDAAPPLAAPAVAPC